MTEIQRNFGRKISPSHLLNLVLITVIAGAAIFGWFYFRKVDPVTQITNVLPATGPGKPKFMFNLWGNESETFVRPLDVTVMDNKIYALDSRNFIWVYDNTGKYITRFAGAGQKKEQLLDPQSLTSYNGNIYVADMRKRKVVVYTGDGKFVGYFAENYLNAPYYIRFIDGKFYIQEGFHVKVFDTGGKMLADIGGRGVEKGQFGVNIGVTADKDGNIYVMDTGNYRIQVFDPQGNFKFSWGRRPGIEPPSGEETPEYDYTRGIAFDKAGYIWVARPMSRMVSVLDPQNGKKLADLKDVEAEGRPFGGPTNLFIDQDNRLFVVDQVGRRIVAFKL